LEWAVTATISAAFAERAIGRGLPEVAEAGRIRALTGSIARASVPSAGPLPAVARDRLEWLPVTLLQSAAASSA
jgi:hypothetical protein